MWVPDGLKYIASEAPTRTIMNMIVLVVIFCVAVNAFRPTNPSRGTFLASSSRKFLFGSPDPKDNAPAKKDGGMFGGMGNLMDSMKKAQEIAKQAEVVNKELMDTVIMGQDPAGAVFATFNGLGVPVGLKISDSIMAQGAEAVSLASTQAMVDAHKKSQETMMTKMQALYSGAGVPMPPQGP